MKDGAILLIDDSESELRLCQIAMQNAKHNHDLLTFRDPQLALEYIKNKRYLYCYFRH